NGAELPFGEVVDTCLAVEAKPRPSVRTIGRTPAAWTTNMRKYRLPRLETRPRIATALTPGTGPPPPSFSWPTPGRLDRDGADWLHLWLREPFVKASRFPRGRVAGRSPVRFRSPAWQSLPVAGLPPAYLAGVGANGSAPAFLLDALP